MKNIPVVILLFLGIIGVAGGLAFFVHVFSGSPIPIVEKCERGGGTVEWTKISEGCINNDGKHDCYWLTCQVYNLLAWAEMKGKKPSAKK
jgi:hypothetical protein